jgi:hypothetical protein
VETWEYTVEELNLDPGYERFEKDLNDFGIGGWEVISALPLPGPGSRILLILKKKKAIIGSEVGTPSERS